eukprot:10203918-Alexandrium_andersonii.AAC.1
MSASLVGSEMCIRDSCRVRAASPEPFRRTVEHPYTLLSRSGLPRIIPVSYTHLTLPTICSV